MKVLVTGVKGQLGYDVMNELAKRGYEGVGVDVAEMDITDSAAVEKVMTEVHPDKVVHCAAWTAVDAAEDNQEACHKVNVMEQLISQKCVENLTFRWFISAQTMYLTDRELVRGSRMIRL